MPERIPMVDEMEEETEEELEEEWRFELKPTLVYSPNVKAGERNL